MDLYTSVDSISVTSKEVGQGIYVNNNKVPVNGVVVSVSNDDVRITTPTGILSFDKATSVLSNAAGFFDLNFTNTAGNLTVTAIDLNTKNLVLKASENILQQGAGTTTAKNITLIAGKAIGTSVDHLNINADSLNVAANNGDIYINSIKTTALALIVKAKGTSSDIHLIHAGDLNLYEANSKVGVVTLNATGNIIGIPAVDIGAIIVAQGLDITGQNITILNTIIEGDVVVTADGEIQMANVGNINLIATTNGNGDLYVDNDGNVILQTISVSGGTLHDATFAINGTLTGGGVVLGLTDHLILNASSIGEMANAIIVNTHNLVIESLGDVYLEQQGTDPIYIPSVVARGDVSITADQTIWLGLINAVNRNVYLTSSADIFDFPVNNNDLNVIAKFLSITAVNAGTETDPLEYKINIISTNISGEMFSDNLGQMALTESVFTNNNSTTLKLTASGFTIFDNGGGHTTVGNDGSLELIAKNGNIIFLNPNDELEVTGAGHITFDASGCSLASGESGMTGTIVSGNLIVGGGNISLIACNHIGIPSLSAKNVLVQANNGFIIDFNGDLTNIMADSVSLIGKSVNTGTLSENMIDASGDRAIRFLRALELSDDVAAYEAIVIRLTTDRLTAFGTYNANVALEAANKIIFENAQQKYDDESTGFAAAELAFQIANGVVAGLELPVGGAQAVPLVGDGGAATALGVVKILLEAADLAMKIAQMAMEDAQAALEEARAKYYGAMAATNTSLTMYNNLTSEFNQATDFLANYKNLKVQADTAYFAAVQIDSLFRKAWRAKNPIGTSNSPLGIDATGNIDAVAMNQSNIYITAPANLPAGHITAQGTTKASRVVLIADAGAITISDAITSTGSVVLCVNDNITNHPLALGTPVVIADSLIAKAVNRIGSETAQIATQIKHLAVNTENEVIFIDNALTDDLNIDNILVNVSCLGGNVIGAKKTVGDTVSITTLGNMVINAPVADATGVVILNASGTITGLATVTPQHIAAQKLFVNCEDGMGTLAMPITTRVDTIQEVNVTNALTGVYINEETTATLGIIGAAGANVVLNAGDEFIAECVNASVVTAKKLTITATAGIANQQVCATNCSGSALGAAIDSLYATTDAGDINIITDNLLSVFVEKATSGNGNVRIHNATGELILGEIAATENLVLAGSILTSIQIISAPSVILEGLNGIGTATEPFLIDAERLQAHASVNDIFINNSSADLTLGPPTTADCMMPASTEGIVNADGNITLVTTGDLTIEGLTQTPQVPDYNIINLTAGGFINTDPATGDLVATARLNATAFGSITIGGHVDSANVLVTGAGDIEINNNSHDMVLVDNFYTPNGTLRIGNGTAIIEVLADLNLTGSAIMIGNPYFKSHMNTYRNSFDVDGNATFGNYAEWVATVEENDPDGRNFMSVSGDVLLEPRFIIIADQYANKTYNIIEVGGTVTGDLSGAMHVYAYNPTLPVADSISRTLIRAYGYNTFAFQGASKWITIQSVHICDTVIDVDGNRYASVGIGSKCWTKSNITATKFNDGRSAPYHLYYSETFNDDSLANLAIYGRLYNWATALDNATNFTTDVQGICPGGWRVPNLTDFEELITYGADSLRSVDYWLQGGNDYYGFSALPAGYYNYIADNSYYLLGDTYFWIAAPNTTSMGKACHLFFGCPEAFIIDFAKEDGASVRCVKVDPLSFP
ncbi:MAG: hypothetical protein LBU51_10560 [Bacteroidales bacterium]|jgi:uncharacterized protein (TIGR02145 family)|nr:hypothetical protein [Bacteroidales bacterium]